MNLFSVVSKTELKFLKVPPATYPLTPQKNTLYFNPQPSSISNFSVLKLLVIFKFVP